MPTSTDVRPAPPAAPPSRGRRVALVVALVLAVVLPAQLWTGGFPAGAPGDDPGSATRARSGTAAAPREPAARSAPPAAPATGAVPAITVDGDRILRGGEPWWFLGYNSFVWSGDCGTDEEKMSAADVEAWFASMRHDGHGAVRLFFYDGWSTERLDAAVAAARENGVYLAITLDDAIGGCGENDKDEAWFADSSERAVFRDHMTALLERYRGETAIAWFEYFNEPDYAGGALREFTTRWVRRPTRSTRTGCSPPARWPPTGSTARRTSATSTSRRASTSPRCTSTTRTRSSPTTAPACGPTPAGSR
ncbi:hypothetical protein [Pseudonocardia broussonetiae]|uniref:Cellulase (Glycosyl hydrolase family 5) n=1 Tax=Pseudonocardia broussonetiae TaxID=2736640 RepID=A0A6M6JIS2_9PSEU|nr:hypothetical protein [Pseudonocardia broussonetiae]QJY47063.1 hypothetical protein HOP40_15625 [Pseudonocardia broussonetiae]